MHDGFRGWINDRNLVRSLILVNYLHRPMPPCTEAIANIWKDYTYPPSAEYYAERFSISSKFGRYAETFGLSCQFKGIYGNFLYTNHQTE